MYDARVGCPVDTGRRGLEYLPDGRVIRYWAGGETCLCASDDIPNKLAMAFLEFVHVFHYTGPARPDTLRRYGFVTE